MIGIAKGSLPGAAGRSPSEALRATAALGLGGILFNSIGELSPTLDPGALGALKAEADALGIGLHAGCGWISPGHPERQREFALWGDGDLSRGIARAAEAAASIGLSDLFFVIGTIDERDDATHPFADELAAVARTIAAAAPALRANGVRLLVKTHEEITSFEILRLVEAVGPDVLGVSLDPVNMLCRIEDPTESARRVAPHVGLVHLEDAIMQFDGQGIRRYLAPIGAGVVDWPAILELVPDVPAFIELHRGQFAMPVFDRAWLAAQPDLSIDEYASVIAMAAHDRTGPLPWDQAAPESRLGAALGYFGKR